MVFNNSYKQNMVSIVMPSYNQGQYIEEALLSVLNQDYPHIELIVIDGGSSDGSIEILKKYNDRIAYWVSEPDHGPVDAINKGLRKCNGEFVGIFFSDDYLFRQAISKKIALFNKEPEIDFIYGDTEVIDAEGNSLYIRRGNDLHYSQWIRSCTMPITLQSSLWRRNIMEQIELLREDMDVATDWDFFLRVCLKGKIKYLPGTTGIFRNHSNSQSMTKQLLWVNLVPKMYKDLFERPDLPEELLTLKNESLANSFVYTVYLLIDHWRINEAFLQLKKAIILYPKILFTIHSIKILESLLIQAIKFFNRKR